jgi:hypothetical protein
LETREKYEFNSEKNGKKYVQKSTILEGLFSMRKKHKTKKNKNLFLVMPKPTLAHTGRILQLDQTMWLLLLRLLLLLLLQFRHFCGRVKTSPLISGEGMKSGV